MISHIISALAFFAAVTFAQNITTISENTTTLLTITSCSNSVCSTAATPAIVSVITVTEHGTVTVVTTNCPVTTTSSSLIPSVPTAAPNITHSIFEGAAANKIAPAAGVIVAAALLL